MKTTKPKITDSMQKVAVDILEHLIFCKTIEEVRGELDRLYEKYELCDDPFTGIPCTTKQYFKNKHEREKQLMVEKYGHCDGLE